MSHLLDLQKMIDKTQGPSARALDKAPRIVQNKIAKVLGYHHDFKSLNPFLKCLMAIQILQKKTTLIDADYQKSRKIFEEQMQSIRAKVTPIKKISELQLKLGSSTIKGRLYHPNPRKQLPLILFYHGGGFVVGSIDTHDEACRILAKHANAQVLSIEYLLAPEHTPTQVVNCCVESLEWVYKNQKKLGVLKGRIAVAGDSAGGNLSAVVAQKTKHTIYKPSAQFLIYPAVDFKTRYASFYKFNKGLVLTQPDIDQVEQLYAEQHYGAKDAPLISPMYGELNEVAPAFVITAGFDILHDEGQIYAEKLKAAGVKAHYCEAKDQTHGFINFTTIHQAAKQHWIKAAQDFRKFWDKNK